MISSNLSAIFYLISGILFILALRGLSSPDTSRQGNYFGIAGMLIAIIVTFDANLKDDDISKFDCGAAVNGLVNAAWLKGLGAVINSQGIMQSPVVRKYANIPDDQVIMICVAMGYPDENFPANKVVSKRRDVEEVATFIGFDD